MIFYPTNYEINLLNLLDDRKNFFLPKVSGLELWFARIIKNEKLEKSSFNIFEPCSYPQNPEILDLVIVPALMADKKRIQIGIWRRFYDRFIPTLKAECKTLTVVPFELLLKNYRRKNLILKQI